MQGKGISGGVSPQPDAQGIAALEKKQRTEPQLNRKIELRKQVKERISVLTELTNPVPSKKD